MGHMRALEKSDSFRGSVMKFRFTILSIIAVVVMTSPAIPDDSMGTRFGTVEAVFPHPESNHVHVIKVRGKVVFKTEDIIGLKEKFSLGNKEVVLFSTNCGGTACTDNLSFLVLEKGWPPKVVTHKDFDSRDGTEKTMVRDGKILVDLGYESKKRKTAVFDGKKLIIQHTLEPGRSLSNEDCKWIYTYALDGVDGSCLYAGKNDPRCVEPFESFALFARRRLGGISQNPVFDGDAFEGVCIETCKSGKALNYDAFRKAFCGQ